MTKRWKITAVLAAVMVCLPALNIAAQQWDGQEASDGKSNTNMVTQGIFMEDRDNYLSVTGIRDLTKNLIFVNFFSPAYFGGQTSSSFDGTASGYGKYFDAGAAFKVGSSWLGAGFRYGITENSGSVEQGSVTESSYQYDATGKPVGNTITTTNGRSSGAIEKNNQKWTVAGAFGNSLWAIKNTFRWNIAEQALRGDNSGMSSVSNSALTQLTTGQAISTNNEVKTTYQGVVDTTKDDFSKGTVANNTLEDEVQFGIFLGSLIPVEAVSRLDPWVSVALNFKHDTGGSALGFERTYTVTNNKAGKQSEKVWGYEKNSSYISLKPGLDLGVSVELSDMFTLYPTLGYAIDFDNIRVNPYTSVGGGDETFGGIVESKYYTTYTYSGIKTDNGKEYKITTTTANRSVDFTKITGVSQDLKAEALLVGNFGPESNREQFRLGIAWAPAFHFEGHSYEVSNQGRTETVYSEGNYKGDRKSYKQVVDTVERLTQERTVDAFKFENTFKIGAQLWVKQDKLRLNAGTSFTNKIVDQTTTTETNYSYAAGSGTVTTTTYPGDSNLNTKTTNPLVISGVTHNQTVSKSGGITNGFGSANYNFGVTWFFNDYVNFDFALASQFNKSNDGWLGLFMPSAWALQLNIRY